MDPRLLGDQSRTTKKLKKKKNNTVQSFNDFFMQLDARECLQNKTGQLYQRTHLALETTHAPHVSTRECLNFRASYQIQQRKTHFGKRFNCSRSPSIFELFDQWTQTIVVASPPPSVRPTSSQFDTARQASRMTVSTKKAGRAASCWRWWLFSRVCLYCSVFEAAPFLVVTKVLLLPLPSRSQGQVGNETRQGTKPVPARTRRTYCVIGRYA